MLIWLTRIYKKKKIDEIETSGRAWVVAHPIASLDYQYIYIYIQFYYAWLFSKSEK